MYEMKEVLDDLAVGKYERQMVMTESGLEVQGNISGGVGESRVGNPGGIIVLSDSIKFENVPLVTPNGDVLARSLSFEITPATNLLISGPNGCGKSSLFRVLGELWPCHGGVVSKPHPRDIFYIPQKPYLAMGTLRDQVIYPHNRAQMNAKGVTDDDL